MTVSKIELTQDQMSVLNLVNNGKRDLYGFGLGDRLPLVRYGLIMLQNNHYYITSLGRLTLLEQNKIEG